MTRDELLSRLEQMEQIRREESDGGRLARAHLDAVALSEARAALEGQGNVPQLVEVFRFTSFYHWVRKAYSMPWTYNGGVVKEVCADAKGRICRNGADFQRARDEDTFPVVAYRISELAPPTQEN